MKKLAIGLGILILGCALQAGDLGNASCKEQGKTASCQKGKMSKEKMLAKINEALERRQAEEEKASGKGNTELASAIQKVITDLNSMKSALESDDKDAFKTANQQREKDRAALESLKKASCKERKQGKESASSQSLADGI